MTIMIRKSINLHIYIYIYIYIYTCKVVKLKKTVIETFLK